MTEVINPYDWSVCLFVCVVGPGFDSTASAFVRSRASQETGSDGQLAQKRNRAPISGAEIVQMSAAFQPRADCVFMEQSGVFIHISGEA